MCSGIGIRNLDLLNSDSNCSNVKSVEISKAFKLLNHWMKNIFKKSKLM